MKNLEQIRARNAITAEGEFKGEDDGQVVKKVPEMIRENGFLGAMAFAIEKQGYAEVFIAILLHVSKAPISLVDERNELNNYHRNKAEILNRYQGSLSGDQKKERDGKIKTLFKDLLSMYLTTISDKNADELRTITAESLAYLNYLRRFA